MTAKDPFHLAFPVHSLLEARRFYVGMLGCVEGRSSEEWIDFNFYGHQVVAHLVKGYSAASDANSVDGDDVPIRHFGVVLSMEDWSELSDKLKQSEVEFLVEPHVRFKGLAGEQATMFVRDLSGNALEFKAFKDLSKLFDQ
ncbi:MAG: VOC family protein [Burkholderiales bacterium]|jgi:extradiol dioxygenase family protein|nr:VOC family protein [Pseudomonadota bacterium]MDA1011661.1 VOC family protein [Pseudomonadota bacterium]|tara:strand:- start:18133 stop:18555 length:423 start_codon:yes stop_codon:yes gene_type:complete